MAFAPIGLNMNLTILIPAFREEENLRIIIPEIVSECNRNTTTFEIIVIGPREQADESSIVCQEHGVRYVERTGGDDYGDAIRTGLEMAFGTYILVMDADGSHDPNMISALCKSAEDAEVVIASRYVEGGSTDNPTILIILSKIVNICYRIVLGVNVLDISNSFKLYRAKDIKSLDLKCKNFDIVEEILFKLVQQNPAIRIKEIPTVFRKRMFGRTKRSLIRFVVTYVFTLFRLRFS